MTQALLKLVEFEEFLAWKPESRSYELYQGLVVEMQKNCGQNILLCN